MPSEIVITGVPELLAKVGRMQAVKVLTPPMVRAVARLQKTAATYPNRNAKQAKAAGMSVKAFRSSGAASEYVRTGNLQRGWQGKVDTSGGGITGTVNNQVPYGPYVMGPGPEKPKQAWMHVGIWQTTDDVADKHKDTIVADFKAAIDGALA